MSDWRAAIDRHIDTIADDLRQVRRHLHAHPEPSREEFRTTLYLSHRLEEAGIPYRLIPTGRGIVAGPQPTAGVRTVGLRADMDALRIQDEKDVEYRSTRPGLMHACGHDAHSTMALGAALALARCRDELPWPVDWRVIFQPAEEVGEGAAEMVAAGAAEGLAAIVALHVAPELPVGRVALRMGVMTAFCQEIDVVVRGAGGHGARPHLSRDPIAASAHLLTTIYQSIPRSFDAREPVVVSFGMIAGGNNANVIPDRVTVRGTLRTLSRATAARVRERVELIAQGVGVATQTEIEVTFGQATEAVVNDPDVSAVCVRAAGEVVGGGHIEEIPLPSMGGEDFSGYLDHVHGCMLRLGVSGTDGGWPSLHTSRFDIDENALPLGAKILARCAVLLARPEPPAGG
jgi:amidohydrolase